MRWKSEAEVLVQSWPSRDQIYNIVRGYIIGALAQIPALYFVNVVYDER
jgi:hypothetical protein